MQIELIKSDNFNVNYLAKIVKIDNFKPHQDPAVNKLKCCSIDGFNIITGIDAQPGLYVYFPIACCINPDFLSYANLYRQKILNRNPECSGMFEDNGRVKAIRLRGELSEGFIISVQVLEDYIISITNKTIQIENNVEFDTIKYGDKTFWFNKKYIPKAEPKKLQGPNLPKSKKPKGYNKIIPTQFRFHYDTVIIKKCPGVIKPDDIISITEKVHGTSGISAYVLCKQELNWKQKIAKWLTKEAFDIYDYVYASRSVVKNPFYNKNVTKGFYDVDVWKYADEIIRPLLVKGMTIYYEIIGYLPNKSYIQKGYDYGCVPPKEDEVYTYDKHFKIKVYRITITNIDGIIHEFSTREVQQWCNYFGLIPVTQYYYGLAKNLYPNIPIDNDWSNNFITQLSDDKNFYMEQNSPTCTNKVPHEGIVIKVENMRSEAFKLKCFKFIDRETVNSEELNIEDNA